MKVKCCRTLIENPNPLVINKDISEWSKVGNIYVVYGIRVAKEAVYYMIFDGSHLIEIPSELFEIIDGDLSELWTLRYDEYDGLKFWPDLFHEKDFFEHFSDWENKERSRFQMLMIQMGHC